MNDLHSIYPPTRSDPSILARNLVAVDLTDTGDLAVSAKAFEVWNGTAADVKLKITSIGTDPAEEAAPFLVTVPAGSLRVVPTSARRIWSTGSTGLAAGLAAGTVEVLLHLR